MVINLKDFTFIPCIMLAMLVMHASVALSDIGMQTLSYLALAAVLCSTLLSGFLYVRGGQVERFELAMFAYQTLIVVSSVIHATDIKNALYLSCAACLLVFVFSYYRHKYKYLLAALAIAFSLCVYANLAHILTHPILLIHEETEQTNAGYLLGNNYNQIGPRVLCAVICNMLCLRMSRWWWLNVIPLIAVSGVTLYIVQSMTSLSCFILFLLLCLIPWRRVQRLCCYGVFGFYVLFQTFVCFGGKSIENNSLSVYLIEEVLHKDITFTYRTDMWESALSTFWESPLIGFGQVTEEWFLSHMSAQAFGPHNFLLSVLLYGGVALLLIFIYLFGNSALHLLCHTSRWSNLLLAAIVVLMLMTTMEMYPFIFIAFLLVLGYHYSNFEAL